MVKMVIFDFDGVIHDTRHDLFSLHQKFFPDEQYGDWLLEAFNTNSGNFFERKYPSEIRETFFTLWNEAHNEFLLDDSMRLFLERMSAQFDLTINTSNWEKNIHIYLTNNSIDSLFIDVFGKDTHWSKAKKFKTILQRFNLTLDDVVFVTDTLGDIVEAHEVGVRTIAVSFGYQPRELLVDGKPWKIVDSLEELEDTLHALA